MHAVQVVQLFADQRFLGGAVHLADAQACQRLAGAGGERGRAGTGNAEGLAAFAVAAATPGGVAVGMGVGMIVTVGRVVVAGVVVAGVVVASVIVAGVVVAGVSVCVVMVVAAIVMRGMVVAGMNSFVLGRRAAGVVRATGAVLPVGHMFVFFDRR
ncbi:hypothetical protein A7P22_06310 [Achromobacter insolitus]|nr:hypothetical protein A7P22_06310 [Achromobacter insolitus]